jgi:hypothetical protein
MAVEQRALLDAVDTVLVDIRREYADTGRLSSQALLECAMRAKND